VERLEESIDRPIRLYKESKLASINESYYKAFNIFVQPVDNIFVQPVHNIFVKPVHNIFVQPVHNIFVHPVHNIFVYNYLFLYKFLTLAYIIRNSLRMICKCRNTYQYYKKQVIF
jgi:hypothetical protein